MIRVERNRRGKNVERVGCRTKEDVVPIRRAAVVRQSNRVRADLSCGRIVENMETACEMPARINATGRG